MSSITKLFISQDIQNLLQKPSEYIIHEATLRALIHVFNLHYDTRIELVAFSDLGQICTKIGRVAALSKERIRKQLIVQIPIQHGIHYAAVDTEFFGTFSCCFIVDASINEESIERLNLRLNPIFNEVYCVRGDERISKLQSDYSSCPLFSLYHAKVCHQLDELYMALKEIPSELAPTGDNTAKDGLVTSKTVNFLWINLPPEFIFPIQSISKARTYIDHHNRAEDDFHKTWSQKMQTSLEAHRFQKNEETPFQNYFIPHLSRECFEMFETISHAITDEMLIALAWAGPQYTAHRQFALMLNFRRTDILSFSTPVEIFNFLTVSSNKLLKKTAKAQVLEDPETLSKIVQLKLPFFQAIATSSLEKVLSNRFVLSHLMIGRLSPAEALSLSPCRLKYLENVKIAEAAETIGCARVLRFPEPTLRALASSTHLSDLLSDWDTARESMSLDEDSTLCSSSLFSEWTEEDETECSEVSSIPSPS